MSVTIHKTDWLEARRCPAKAWFGIHVGISPPGPAIDFLVDQGREIALKARELFPGATFNARYQAGPLSVTVDILDRVETGGWRVFEVRSSLASKPNSRRTGDARDLLGDLAYTVMVLRRAGLEIVGASVLLLSPQYRYGDPVDKLFEIFDKTELVEERVLEFEEQFPALSETLLSAEPPAVALNANCRKCEYFATHCIGRGIAHSVLEIPHLRFKEMQMLSDAGIVDFNAVPDDFPLIERQQRAKYCVQTGNRYIGPQLKGKLESIQWPCYYLDFESVMTALPLHRGHGCYRPILTQFSVHRREHFDAPPTHAEYLADAQRDCDREFAEALLAALGDTGSIFVYSVFEQDSIQALVAQFPDLAERLQNLVFRLVDLLPIIQKYVYDAAFRGRTTLKRVLPALVPDLSYKGLAIQDGGTAVALFARMAHGEISGDAMAQTRRDLLEYCAMDTLAMVRLHEALWSLCAVRQAFPAGAF